MYVHKDSVSKFKYVLVLLFKNTKIFCINWIKINYFYRMLRRMSSSLESNVPTQVSKVLKVILY